MLLNDKVQFRMQWPQYADLQVNGMVIKVFVLLYDELCGFKLSITLSHVLYKQVCLSVRSIDLARNCLELMVVMMVQLWVYAPT